MHCKMQLDILFLFTGRNLDKEIIKEVFVATVREERGNSWHKTIKKIKCLF